jgi:hypothetical protein
MRKLAMLLLVATMLTAGVSQAYAEPPEPCFDDDFVFFLNPQPLPPG